ncbi:MAG: lysophospholipid acyltransferase family protein [Candidatus Omnitrophota bacterium]
MNKENKKFLARFFTGRSLRLFNFLIPKRSLKCIYRVGAVLGRAAYVFVGRHRKVALNSLSTAFPELKEKERIKIAKSFFIFISQSVLELYYFLYNPAAAENIRIEGKEFLDRALKYNKGVIAVTAHMGSFPLICYKLGRLGYKVRVVFRPIRDRMVRQYVDGLRKEAGIKAIFSYPRKQCVVDIVNALRDNEIVLILIDQNFGTGGVWVKFFNNLAATPAGPVVFALRTQAKVLPIYIIREGVGRHCIKIFPHIELETRKDKDETILLNTVKFTAIIEHWVREFPCQWAWIHRRWKSRPSEKVLNTKFRVQRY